MTDTRTIIPVPTPITPLIGRDGELARLLEMLQAGKRLVTITGIGGMGKTRLSIQVALELEPDFDNGAMSVPLADVRGAAQIPVEIARKLGVFQSEVDVPSLATMLGGDSRLLVLDNLEQISNAGLVIAELLATLPNLTLLCTSQVPLAIDGEQVYPLGPIAVPVSNLHASELRSTPAVQLFIQRAERADSGLMFDDQDVHIIGEVCTVLDGIPLAIELAAARSFVLPPEALLVRLANSLDLLGGGGAHLPDRLRTMRHAIAWSYALLTPDDRRVFRYLGVYAGNISIEAIAHTLDMLEMTTTPWDMIDDLVSRSLLRKVQGGEAPRYQMLQVLREFAREQLVAEGDDFSAHLAHATYVANLAVQAEQPIRGEQQAIWFGRLSNDAGNIRAATDWSACHRPEIVLRVIASIWKFFEYNGESVHYAELGQSLSIEGVPDAVLARGLLGISSLDSDTFRDPDLTFATIDRAIDIAKQIGDQKTHARALNCLGSLHMQLGNLDISEKFHQESREVSLATGDTLDLFSATANLAINAFHRGDHILARDRMLAALPIVESIGNRATIARVYTNLGLFYKEEGEYEISRDYLVRALTLAQETGSIADEFSSRFNLANTSLLLEDFSAAASHFEAALAITVSTNRRVDEAEIRTAYTEFFLHQGDHAGAAAQIVEIAALAINEAAARALVTCTGVVMEFAHQTGQAETAAALLGGFQQWQQKVSAQIPDRIAATIGRIEATIPTEGKDPLRTAREDGGQWTYEELRLNTLRAAQRYLRRMPRTGQTDPEPVTQTQRPPLLTPREMEVLDHMALGESNPEIASAMFISRRTISTHVSNILAKLEVDSRSSAVSTAIRMGLI